MDLSNKSADGWYSATCPFCGSTDKFGVRFNEDRSKYKNHITYNCFKGKCASHGTEWTLFEELGIKHLLHHKEFIKGEQVEGDLIDSVEVVEEELLDQEEPSGWTRIMSHPYLDDRGFDQYEKYEVGVTRNFFNRGYLIFLLRQGGSIKGSIGRSFEGHEMKYKNQSGVDFGKIAFGSDEINEETKAIIIVEGIFDKFNVEKLLNLNGTDKLKCVCTFGKKISQFQIDVIKDKGESIDEVILMYDPEEIKALKKYGTMLRYNFNKVTVASLPIGNDPGDVNRVDLLKSLEVRDSISNFTINKI